MSSKNGVGEHWLAFEEITGQAMNRQGLRRRPPEEVAVDVRPVSGG
jgi:hypothetical protein